MLTRVGETVTRQSHNLKIAGSIPAPAIVRRVCVLGETETMNTFLTNALADRSARTGNGAVAYRSTTSAVLNLFSDGGALRGRSAEALNLFKQAYSEDKRLAVLCAFFLRDVRGGAGERQIFRDILKWLSQNDADLFKRIVPFVAEYGRWDDLIAIESPYADQYVIAQLELDMLSSGNTSLLAKWMPSINASSPVTILRAREFAKKMGVSEKRYRKMLSALRARLKVVEVSMSAREWNDINYSSVGSKAMKLYRGAFGKRDNSRFTKWLASVEKGEAKINSSTLMPYEIVAPFYNGDGDPVLEAMWNALPDFTDGSSTLVVADTSGSMAGHTVPKTRANGLHVAISLALYFAGKNKGPFADIAAVFSTRSEFVKLHGNLSARVEQMKQLDWGGSTNVQALFDNVLAAMKGAKPEDCPKRIIIISDMQFDSCGGRNTNFELAKKKFAAAGLQFPKVVFWNVNATVGTYPAKANDQGVYMVSGLSAALAKAVLNDKAEDPYDLMLQTLASDRYRKVAEALS
jgi:Domain of unknown function (DUF2828)/von Willebrand factor type A domain